MISFRRKVVNKNIIQKMVTELYKDTDEGRRVL
jgi:hypothetical protein